MPKTEPPAICSKVFASESTVLAPQHQSKPTSTMNNYTFSQLLTTSTDILRIHVSCPICSKKLSVIGTHTDSKLMSISTAVDDTQMAGHFDP